MLSSNINDPPQRITSMAELPAPGSQHLCMSRASLVSLAGIISRYLTWGQHFKNQHWALSTETCPTTYTGASYFVIGSSKFGLNFKIWILEDKSKRFCRPKPSVGHCSELPAATVFPVISSTAFIFQQKCSLENVLEMQAHVAVPSRTPCAAAQHPLCCPHRHRHSFSCA